MREVKGSLESVEGEDSCLKGSLYTGWTDERGQAQSREC